MFDSIGAPLVGPDGEFVYATTALADSPAAAERRHHHPVRQRRVGSGDRHHPAGPLDRPRPVGRIVLVDPVAERELLGEAGAFLDPLIDYTGEGSR